MAKKTLLRSIPFFFVVLTLLSQSAFVLASAKKFDKSTKINSDVIDLGFEIDDNIPEESYVVKYDNNGKNYSVPFSFLRDKKLVFRAPQTANYELVSNKKNFADVNENSNCAFNSDIAFVSSHELMNGIDENNFGSEINLTRSMFIQIIARLDNADLSLYDKNNFLSSNEKDTWHIPALTWALSNNLIIGPMNSFSFEPDEPITRQDAATVLYSYSQYKNFLLWQPGLLLARAPFTDYDEIDDYARTAATKLNWAGVFGTKSGYNFKPKDYLTRGETAGIIKRFIEQITEIN